MYTKPVIQQVKSNEKTVAAIWRAVEVGCAFVLICALFFALKGFITPQQVLAGSDSLVLLAPLNLSMLALISFVSLVVVRYAKRNLNADPDSPRFLLWLGLTVAAVMVTVISNHLLLFWLAWGSISLSLHQLLMFYPDRPRAALAAHKKFILARLAETLLGAALLLLYFHHGTAYISEILSAYPVAQLALSEQIAAFLIALVALIKCAQLPLHGWLIQVVESPTPVSALLHAGVINLGGFLLLQFSPLFGQAVLAQSVVLIAAGLTTVLAALVMVTRISIKVRLAWSTTAQMGLMLVQCALGLYELALLHLLAHSCYKAHAFLTAGEEVNRYLQRKLVGLKLPETKAWVFAGATTGVVLLLGLLIAGGQGLVTPWVVLALALLVLLASRYESDNVGAQISSVLFAVAILFVYTALRWTTQWFAPSAEVSVHWLADLWISLLFVGLFLAYQALQYRPTDHRSQRLFIALNAGFYLDEWASRWTLRIWPARLPRTKEHPTHTQEAFL